MLPFHDKTKCDGCGSCYMACAYGAIEMGERYAELIPDKCEGCGLCVSVCPRKAISQNYFE